MMTETDKKVKVTVSLDREALDLLDAYADELHLTRSGFIGFMVTQIDQVVRVGRPREKENEAAPSGDD